jgi:hypothetical protein
MAHMCDDLKSLYRQRIRYLTAGRDDAIGQLAEIEPAAPDQFKVVRGMPDAKGIGGGAT